MEKEREKEKGGGEGLSAGRRVERGASWQIGPQHGRAREARPQSKATEATARPQGSSTY